MPSEKQRKRRQASRQAIRLKPCGEPLEKIIKLLGKLPLDTPLIDLDQHEALRKLRSEKLSVSVSNIFKTKTQPYPSEMVRTAWRRNTGTDFPIALNDWPAAERERIAGAKKVQEEEEAKYQQAYKRAQIETLARYISSLDREFIDYILGENRSTLMSMHEIDSAVLRYNWYRFHHDFMRALIDAVQRREEGKSFHLASALPSGAFIGPKGRFRAKLAPIVEALIGVEVDRIRMCANKNCRRIFWAGRIAKPGSTRNDQVCCSPECSHASRNQRLRARYSDPADDFAARKLTANEKSLKKKARRKGE